MNKTAITFLFSLSTLMLAGCCAAGRETKSPEFTPSEIRDKLVGKWDLVSRTISSESQTLIFLADGRVTSVLNGEPARTNYWRVEERAVNMIVVTREPGQLAYASYCFWSIRQLDDHNFVVFPYGFSVAGPPVRYKR